MRQGRVIATVLFLGLIFSLTAAVQGQARGRTPRGRPPRGRPFQELQVQIDALRQQNAQLEAQVADHEARIVPLETAILPVADLGHYVRVQLGDINDLAGPHIIFEGANVHIRSGFGFTEDDTTGLGNLVVGYNEKPTGGHGSADRDGAHNLVVGPQHEYQSWGGFVAGYRNSISGRNASVSGGSENEAKGRGSSVSGGDNNTASGSWSSVSGGESNTAIGNAGSVSGGAGNRAIGGAASVSGGLINTASGNLSSVNGGRGNEAGGPESSVSGGYNRSASGSRDWRAGGLFEDQ